MLKVHHTEREDEGAIDSSSLAENVSRCWVSCSLPIHPQFLSGQVYNFDLEIKSDTIP